MTMSSSELAVEPIKTVAYLRVSTEDQARFGWSLEAQRTRMQGYAVAYSLEIVAWVTDDESATKPTSKRPGFQMALEELNSGRAEAMLVASVDRFSRNVLEALKVLHENGFTPDENGVVGKRLFSLNEKCDLADPDEYCFFVQRLAFAQREAMVTSRRTKIGLKQARLEGRALGAPSIVRDLSAATLDRVEELKFKQNKSAKQIATALRNEGHPTARGGEWRKNTALSAIRAVEARRAAAALQRDQERQRATETDADLHV